MTSAPRSDHSADTPWPAPDTDGQDREGDRETVVTRSEERVHIRTVRVPTTRVRLRKRIVTETRTLTVQVSREELVEEREPITGPDDQSLEQGTPPAPQELEIVLYEERPVVTMETVAVERISVRTHTVTDDQTITEAVGKEQIELHRDPPGPTPDPSADPHHSS